MKRLFVALLLVTACAAPQKSETKEPGDTLKVTELEQLPNDTIYNPLNLAGKFKERQLDPKIGYVYDVGGLDVFETDGGLSVIGHIDYKTKVKLLDSLKGDNVPIEFQGKTGYVASIDILNLPVPATKNVVEYFTNTLMLSKDPVEKKNAADLDNTDGMFSYASYVFEGGFRMETAEQYENGSTKVTLPGMSLYQTFLFASYFYDSFGVFEEFPNDERDEQLPEDTHVYVGLDDGKIVIITVDKGDGCSWSDSIYFDEDGCVMSSGGGC